MAEAVLDEPFAQVVDLVYARIEPETYCVRSRDGELIFSRRTTDDGAPSYIDEALTGNTPVPREDDGWLVGREAELAAGCPDVADDSFPYARDNIAQLFDGDHAPDMVIQHHPAHAYGGNVGQHGSLAVTQARAPFVAAGPGVLSNGVVDASMRMIDVAPSVARLLGIEPVDGDGQFMLRQDGTANRDLFAFGGAKRVMLFLLDGLNPNALATAVASGRAPNIAALMGRGAQLRRGVLASAPTATLANHTTANTGLHPGHTGVLHHAWHDRQRNVQPNLLSLGEMFTATDHLRSDAETLHEAIHRNDPTAFTTASFEFCDRGANASSFAPIRMGAMPDLPIANQLGAYHLEWITTVADYGFMSSVDERSMLDTISWWDGSQGNPLPRFSWVSLSVTDEAGHVAGPHAEMTLDAITDSDRRVGRILDAVDRAGAMDETTFIVMADHGMAASNAESNQPFGPALDAVSDRYLDVGDGFIYLR